jgi:hypothetical protein
MSIEEKLKDYPGVELVATTGEQQYVLRMPNGTYQYLDEASGYTSTDETVVNNAMASTQDENIPSPAQMYQTRMAQDIVDQAPTTARMQKLSEGLPFIGSYSNEMTGALLGEDKAQQARVLSEAKQMVDPAESTGLKLTSGLLGGYGIAKGVEKGVPAMSKWLSQLPTQQRVLYGTGIGGLGGATEGTIYGYGEGEDMPSNSQLEAWRQQDRFLGSLEEYKAHFLKQNPTRWQTAQEGGKWGALGGSIGATAGEALGGLTKQTVKGWDKLTNLFSKVKVDTTSAIKTIATELKISEKAAQVIHEEMTTGGGDLITALENLRKAGDQGMIVDASNATKALVDTANQSGAGDIVETAITDRTKTEGARTRQVMADVFGEVPVDEQGIELSVKNMALAINKATEKQRGDAYKKAYDHVVDYKSVSGQQINSVLGRVSKGEMDKAIKEANAQLKDEGLPQFQLMARFDTQGNISFEKDLNFIQLDYIRRGLNSLGGTRDTIGNFTPEALRAQRQARDLKSAMVGSNPSYGKALDIASDTISLRENLKEGTLIFRPNYEPADVRDFLKGANKSEKDMFKLGFAKAINKKLGDAKAQLTGADASDVAIRQIWKDLSSGNMKQKVLLISGKGGYNQLQKQLQQLESAINIRNSVASNSATHKRTVIQGRIKEKAEGGAFESVKRGDIAGAGQKTIGAVTGSGEDLVTKRTKSMNREIANAMVNIKGKEARKALKIIYDAIKRGERIDENLIQASDIIINNLPAFTIGGVVTERELNQE